MSTKSEKKRRGRPPRHGGYSLMTRGELPENRRYLAPYLTAVREGLIRDLGPTEADLTTAQRVLVDRVVNFLGIARLIEEYVKDRGIFQNPQGFLNPALSKNYLAYCGHIQRALMALGIDKRQSSDIVDLGKYLEAKAVEAGSPGESSGAGEIGRPDAPERDISGIQPDGPAEKADKAENGGF